MSRLSVLSGQVFGKVDWVTADGKELGMFIKTSDRDSNRVVLQGPEVEQMVKNNLVQKGMMVTAHGEYRARVFTRKADNTHTAELLCIAQRVVAEPPRENRMRGVIYSLLKSVVMYWDPRALQLKTYFNYDEPGVASQVTCSLSLQSWLGELAPESRERFVAAMRAGREFVASNVTELSVYESQGQLVPMLKLLPTDFKLQG
jgi:hypothetical protein